MGVGKIKAQAIIRNLREERKLTQSYIAKYLGVVQQTYSNYEKGYTLISLEHMSKLADYYGVSTDYIMGRTSFCKPATELNAEYSDNKAIGTVLSEILQLGMDRRRDLLDYIEFLKLKEAKRGISHE